MTPAFNLALVNKRSAAWPRLCSRVAFHEANSCNCWNLRSKCIVSHYYRIVEIILVLAWIQIKGIWLSFNASMIILTFCWWIFWQYLQTFRRNVNCQVLSYYVFTLSQWPLSKIVRLRWYICFAECTACPI